MGDILLLTPRAVAPARAPRAGAGLARAAFQAADDDVVVALDMLADAISIIEQQRLYEMAERLLGPTSNDGGRSVS